MMTNRFIRADIQNMTAYSVAQIPEHFIKLDAMEVPYRFPKHLQEELAKQLADAPVNRYPNPACSGLQEALRQSFGIPDDAVIALGNGSDELIQLLTLLVAKQGALVLAVEPSFVMYRHNAALLGLKYIGVPLNPDFTLNRNAFLAAVKQHQPALVWLAYPNNPTGVLFTRADIEAILAVAQGIVVVDEAYGAFSNDSFLSQAGQYENLVVLRTLSKIGFAGLRIGYAAGHALVMNQLAKIVPPYNMNQLSLIAAKFALQHMDMVNGYIDLLKTERQRLIAALTTLPNTQVFSSEANFVTMRFPDADMVFSRLYENGILVKKLHGNHTLLSQCLRFTVGTPEQNDAVLMALKRTVD